MKFLRTKKLKFVRNVVILAIVYVMFIYFAGYAIAEVIVKNQTVETTAESLSDVITVSNISYDEGEKENNNDISVLFVIFLIIVFVIYFFYTFKINKMEEKYKSTLDDVDKVRCEKIISLQDEKEYSEKRDEYIIFQLRAHLKYSDTIIAKKEQENAEFIKKNKVWHDLALSIYPKLDEEVKLLKEKNDKKIAETAFKQMKSIAEGKSGYHEDFSELQRAYSIYDMLTSDQKQYFYHEEWLKEFQSKFDTAKRAENCYQIVNKIESQIDIILARSNLAAMLQHRLELISDLVYWMKSRVKYNPKTTFDDVIAQFKKELDQFLAIRDVGTISEEDENLLRNVEWLLKVAQENYSDAISIEQYRKSINDSFKEIEIARKDYNNKVLTYNKMVQEFTSIFLSNFEKIETFSDGESENNAD